MKLQKDQKVVWDHPRYGPTIGHVKRVAVDGSWVVIHAPTGLGATWESKRYEGDRLANWKPTGD